MDEEQRKLFESLSRLAGASDDLSDKLQSQIDNYNVLLVAGTKEQAEMAKNAAIVTKTNQAYEQQMKALGLTKNALGEYERITTKLTHEQKKRIAEEQALNDRQQAREKISALYYSMLADKTGTATKALSKFSEGLNKTAFDSSKGQAKYGEQLTSAGEKLQMFGALFGPLGKAVTFVVGGLMKLGGAALEQQEHLNTAYEKMAEFGAIDVTGVSGMFKNLQNAGFTVKELDKFGSILKTAGPNLATMGVTAADGAKKFADTLGAIKNTGAEKELRMLGFTSETMAKTFADYQGLMARQGFLQGKTTAQIAQESVKYAKTLDELSKLTGESRDEIQKKMDADANDMKFRLKLQEVDGDTRERLQKASVLIADFGEDTASGFREMVANNGKVVGDASAKLMLSTGNAAKVIVDRLNAGEISSTEAASLMAEAKAKQVERFREVGKLDSDIMKELGLSVKDMDAINKYRGKTQKEIEEMEKKQKEQAKGEADKQRAAEVARQMTERNLEQSKDRLVNIMGTKLVGAFEKLMKMVNQVAKQLAHFAAWLGGPDFTDLFDTPEDVKAKLEKAQKELADAQTEAAKNMPNFQGLTGEERMQAESEWQSKQGAGALEDKRREVEKLKSRYKEMTGEAPVAGAGAGTKAAPGAAPSGTGTASQQDLAKMGLKIKQGDVQREGGDLDPKVLEMAKQVQEQIPNFKHFSSFNDNFHKDGSSKHAKGKAFDFTVTKSPTKEEGEEVVSILKRMGATLAIDEYNSPSAKATAGHYHAEMAKNGGLFSGPDSGYPVLMHGKELIIPMPNTGDLGSALSSVNKTPLSDVAAASNASSGSSMDQFVALQTELMNMISSKLDALDSRLAKSNDIQENILTYSAA